MAALAGAWLALLVGGIVPVRVGPLTGQAALRPAWTGDTVIDLAPLGQLRLDTHDGPLALWVQVDELDPTRASELVADPSLIVGLQERIVVDAQAGLRTVVARAVGVALLGAALATLVTTRWPRRALTRSGAGVGVAALGLALSTGVGAATWHPDEALKTPSYSGLLLNIPSLVGDLQRIATDFSAYQGQLARLVTNVSRLYETALALPGYTPDPGTVRLLVVSDIHLNPLAFDVIESVVEQFDVDAVVDAGDIADHGFAAENQLFVPRIAELDVPYFFVRGNHDSQVTASAIDALPGAEVLDGTAGHVDGVRILGVGDPRFTPDKDMRDQPAPPSVPEVGHQLAQQAWALAQSGNPVDIAVVHDSQAARRLDGTVPLVVAGHVHRRDDEVLAAGTRLFVQGSTGGSGLRALEKEEPAPVTLSVWYLDRPSRRLAAWDDITVGGLGESSATITRRQVPEEERSAFRPSPPGRFPER